MYRSDVTIDLGALRRNVRRLRQAAGPAELWAVVKADAYGHGAADVARVCIDEGAAALCVATAREGASLRETAPATRIVVMSPVGRDDEELARQAELELCVSAPELPAGVRVHLKVDTGMGRWGMSVEDALAVPREPVVGLMSHFATADESDSRFAREQLARFQSILERFPGAPAHIANSAATLALPDARFDAVRCGVALYGLSPFGDDPGRHGLDPVLSWRSEVALTKMLGPGGSTGYGRRFVAERDTKIGLVPVGYADGFRRGLSGAEVLVDGVRRRVLGSVSMDSFAVALGGETVGAPVTMIGDGLLAEEHARHLGTINYEITCGIRADPLRAGRSIVDG
jgi:alanine racemase